MASLSDSKDEKELSALMKKAQGGDEVAYRELLVRIEKMLQSFVKKSVSLQNTDDVIQEIILAVHKKRHTFNTELFFLPWLYAIARHKVVDYIRVKTKAEVISLAPEEFERILTSDTDGVMTSVTVDDLDGFLAHLPEKQREVVRTVKIEGLSVKDAALKLSLSESDVKVNIHRALKSLKTLFAEGKSE